MLTPTQTDYEDHSCLCTGKIQNPLAVHNGKRFRNIDYHSHKSRKSIHLILNTIMKDFEFSDTKL